MPRPTATVSGVHTMGKIERFPNGQLTAGTLLHMVLDDPDVQKVAVVSMDAEGRMWAAWSEMSISELSMAALHLQKEAMDVIE